MLYTRAAKMRLQALPPEVRLHLETHLENLSLLVEATPPERLPQLLTREEEGFVTEVRGLRVFFVVDTAVHSTLLVYRLEAPQEEPWLIGSGSSLSLKGGGGFFP